MKIGVDDENAIGALTGGGYITNTLRKLVASISTGFNLEHDTETNRHSTIHASGAVYERGRSVPMGEFITIPAGAVRFVGNGAMTWTVPAASQATYDYTFSGTQILLSWYLTGTSVGGTPDTALMLPLPPGMLSVKTRRVPFSYSDNGTQGTGIALASSTAPNNTFIFLFTANLANWTASAANTLVAGEIAIEVA